jgi:hypothetical protein
VAEVQVDLCELAGGGRLWKSNNYVEEARTFHVQNTSGEPMPLSLQVRHKRGRPSAGLRWHDSHVRTKYLSATHTVLESEDEGLSEATVMQDGDWNDAVVELEIQKTSDQSS